MRYISTRNFRPRRRGLTSRLALLLLIVATVLTGSLLLWVLTLATRDDDGSGPLPNNTPPDISPRLTPTQGANSPPIILDRGIDRESAALGSFEAQQGEIQVPRRNTKTGSVGVLAQRFVYDRVEPMETPGWQRFVNPRVWIYVSDSKVIYMTAEEAELYVPEQRPQTGELKGSVRLLYIEQLADGPDAYSSAILEQAPIAIFESRTLSLDMETFEARSDAAFTLRTSAFAFAGVGLSLVYDEKLGQLARLTVDNRRSLIYRPPATASHADQSVVHDMGRTVFASYRIDQPATQPAQSYSDQVAQADFYDVDMSGQIIITRGLGRHQVKAEGRHLTADFGLAQGLAQVDLAQGPEDRSSTVSSLQFPLPTLLASLLMGQSGAEIDVFPLTGESHVDDHDVVITGAGPLTVRPYAQRPDSLRSDLDTRVMLEGDPLLLSSDDVSVTGMRMEYAQDDGTIRVDPALGQSLNVDLKDVGTLTSREAIYVDIKSQAAEFRGQVSFKRDSVPPADPIENLHESMDLAAMPPGLTITSSRGLDLFFDESRSKNGDFGPIKSAQFKGDVRVTDPREYTLGAEDLTAEFSPAAVPSDDPILSAIVAKGDVRLSSRDGTAGGDEMVISFELNGDQVPTPTEVELVGKVFAEDENQSIRSGYLRLTLEEEDPADNASEVPEQVQPSRRDTGEAVRVSKVLAQKNVSIRLADGTRVYADRLDGNAAVSTGTITGSPVVVHAGFAQSIGSRLEIRDHEPRLSWIGQSTTVIIQPTKGDQDPAAPTGSMQSDDRGAINLSPNRLFEESTRRLGAATPGAEDASFPIPAIPDWVMNEPWEGTPPLATEIDAWQAFRIRSRDGADYNAESGLIEFRGMVLAEHGSSRFERNTLTAGRVRVELTEPPMNVLESTSTTRREIIGAIATGSKESPAKLQAYRFFDDQQRVPKIGLYVEAPVIDANRLTEQILAIGEGRMLLTDARPTDEPESASENTAKAPSKIAMSGRGSTAFEWKDRLTVDGDKQSITINDGVRMLHRPLGDQDVMHLQAVRLVASFQPANELAKWSIEEDQTLVLTSAMAEGNVFVDAGRRKVSAHVMNYSEKTHTATLDAVPDGFVSIESTETLSPLQARRVIWNMFDNTVRIEGSAPIVNPGPGG